MHFDIQTFCPYVRFVRMNRDRGVSRAYIDPDYVFTYIREGGGRFLLEGRGYDVRRGDIILMPPYMLHIIKASANMEIVQYVIHFDLFYRKRRRGPIPLLPRMTFRRFRRMRGNPETMLAAGPYVLSPPGEDQKMIENLFCRMAKTFQDKGKAYELTVKAGLLDILAIYLRNASSETRVRRLSSKGWRNLEKAIGFIQQNYRRPLALIEVSRAAGLSLNYCCRLFKSYMHTTIHRHINNVRIHHAKMLIEQAELNFSQIAEAVGFSNVHLFSRLFKKIEGETPSRYRRMKFF